MRLGSLSALLVTLAAAVGLAQPPAPPQPLPAGMVPVGSAAPAPPPEAPITKFEPLAAFPAPTQQAVRGVAAGGDWLVRMNQAQGRFVHGYRPAVRQVMEGDNHLRQAFGALGLARAAKFTGEPRAAAVASQAVLALLSAAPPDPADPTCRVPTGPSGERVGFAAVLALAVYELPGTDSRLHDAAEQLCTFIRKAPDPLGGNELPGLALAALVTGHKVRPDAAKADFVAKGLAAQRAAFRAAPHPLLAATLIPVYADVHLQSPNHEAAAAVFEMADWLCGLQYPAAFARNPAWGGGFRGVANGQPADAEPTCDSAACLAALGWAYKVTARNADVPRADRYRQAAQDAAQFVTSLQYTEPNTRHFENTFRVNVLIGGFHPTPSDGDLRVDAVGRCVSGLACYLASGAER